MDLSSATTPSTVPDINGFTYNNDGLNTQSTESYTENVLIPDFNKTLTQQYANDPAQQQKESLNQYVSNIDRYARQSN